jgi:hypothetical protein
VHLYVVWFLRLHGRGSDTNHKPCFDSDLCTTERMWLAREPGAGSGERGAGSRDKESGEQGLS